MRLRHTAVDHLWLFGASSEVWVSHAGSNVIVAVPGASPAAGVSLLPSHA